MVQENCQRQRIPRTHSKAEQTLRIEDLSGGLRDEPGEESQPTETTDDAEARADFWSIQGDFIYRQSQWTTGSTLRAEGKTFPILLKYIDGTWSTPTELDVLQEKRIDDYKNDDSGRYLSDSWRGFNLHKDWQRFKQLPRPDHEKPEIWTKIGKTGQNREIQEWAKEKSKLDNARKWEEFTLLIQRTKNTKKLSRMRRETGKTRGTNYAV